MSADSPSHHHPKSPLSPQRVADLSDVGLRARVQSGQVNKRVEILLSCLLHQTAAQKKPWGARDPPWTSDSINLGPFGSRQKSTPQWSVAFKQSLKRITYLGNSRYAAKAVNGEYLCPLSGSIGLHMLSFEPLIKYWLTR